MSLFKRNEVQCTFTAPSSSAANKSKSVPLSTNLLSSETQNQWTASSAATELKRNLPKAPFQKTFGERNLSNASKSMQMRVVWMHWIRKNAHLEAVLARCLKSAVPDFNDVVFCVATINCYWSEAHPSPKRAILVPKLPKPLPFGHHGE